MTSLSLRYKKLVLFGDSITEFAYDPYATTSGNPDQVQFLFGAYVTSKYNRRLDVVERGYAGFSTEQARKVYPVALLHLEDVVLGTIFFGTNDAIDSGSQAVDLDTFLENMEYMIDLALEKNIKLVVFGPTLHNPELWKKFYPEEAEAGRFRSSERNKVYLEALKDLCARKQVAFGDLYSAFSQHDDPDLLLADGTHFSGEGYQVMAQVFDEAIRTFYPEFLPENLDVKLPWWTEIGDLMDHLS